MHLRLKKIVSFYVLCFSMTILYANSYNWFDGVLDEIDVDAPWEFKEKAKEYAKKDGSGTIQEKHYYEAIADVVLGEKCDFKVPLQEEQRAAHRTAGYALAAIFALKASILFYVEIEPRRQKRLISTEFDGRTRRKTYKFDPVFGGAFVKRGDLMQIESLTDRLAYTFAGTVAEQISENKLLDKTDAELLQEFNAMLAGRFDIENIDMLYKEWQESFFGFIYGKKGFEDIKLNAYKQAKEIILSNRSQWEQIADFLIKNKKVTSKQDIDHLYEICNKKRPLDHLERVALEDENT